MTIHLLFRLLLYLLSIHLHALLTIRNTMRSSLVDNFMILYDTGIDCSRGETSAPQPLALALDHEVQPR